MSESDFVGEKPLPPVSCLPLEEQLKRMTHQRNELARLLFSNNYCYRGEKPEREQLAEELTNSVLESVDIEDLEKKFSDMMDDLRVAIRALVVPEVDRDARIAIHLNAIIGNPYADEGYNFITDDWNDHDYRRPGDDS